MFFYSFLVSLKQNDLQITLGGNNCILMKNNIVASSTVAIICLTFPYLDWHFLKKKALKISVTL